MRAVIQRVLEASVHIDEALFSEIKEGVVILLGIEPLDTEEDIRWLSRKIVNLRIFNDLDGVMNKSLLERKASALVVSQFTLHASTKKGNRPSYIKAAKPPIALPLYETFVQQLESDLGTVVKTGVFGADMQLHLVNDGPVTILIDTKSKE